MNSDLGACSRPCAIGCGLHDSADHLVAEQHRFAQDRLACSAIQPVVQVGAADAAVCDVHDRLIWLHTRAVDQLDAQVILAVRDDPERG
jgi:hypothetical protein